MQDFQNSMETFFLNVFNSSVPAYSGDDSHTRATIVRDFMKNILDVLTTPEAIALLITTAYIIWQNPGICQRNL